MSEATRLKALAERLSDAYSTDRYRNGWGPTCRILTQQGYNERQIEAIVRSKWSRWAADSGGKRYGQATAKDLLDFVIKQGPDALNQLVADTII